MAKKKSRPDGLYEKKITVGHGSDGKPIRLSFYGHSDKEIEAKLKEYYKQEAYGTIDKSISLADWADKWLATYKEGNVRGKTYEMYESCIEKHIKPHFKKSFLAYIKPVDIQTFLNSKSALSQSLLEKLKITLGGIFETAIANELIVRNPVKGIKPKSDKRSQPRLSYSAEEAGQLIEFAKTHKDGAAIIVLLKTGLRRGELCGLKWSDVDFKTNTITVRHSVSLVGGSAVLDMPKTESSKREIPFDDGLAKVLALIPRFTTSKKISVQHGFVFVNSKGKMLNPGNWSKRTYADFMKDYQNNYAAEYEKNHGKAPETLPRTLDPHELRHTFGTLLYESTKDIYITSKTLGHSSVDITAKIYVHENSETKRAAIAKVLPLAK